MKSGHDINKIQNSGYLILPLSMSRLATAQDPKACYEMFGYFLKKLEEYSNDVVLLYTNGLYFNSVDISFENRKKLNQQVLNHSSALRNLVQKNKEYIPNAFHFLPIDYVMLNSPYFADFFSRLKKLEQEDTQFRKLLEEDSKGREYNEANINFLLEEITVAHILRQHLVELPRTLARNDIWRLIVYPGLYLQSDAYQWQKGILPKDDNLNPYAGAQYDYEQKKLFVFDEVDVGGRL